MENKTKPLGPPIAMDPAWIHQSRLNYRYIFNQLNSYWPDWATLQFSPFQTKFHTPPKSGISCLNTSTRQCFSFFTQNQNHRLDINNQGYISFPYLHWGVSLKIFENNEFHPFFHPLHLDPKLSQINYSHVDDQKLTSSFKLNYCKETSTARIEIKFKNASDFPIKKSLNLGAVPYTNEGVGAFGQYNIIAIHQ